MPEIVSETFQCHSGAWSYRILIDGVPRLTSGPFLHQRDAEDCGAHFAADTVSLLDFLER